MSDLDAIKPIDVSAIETDEVRRLAGTSEKFGLWLEVYRTIKSGYEGQSAIDRVNQSLKLVEEKKLSYQTYKAILRSFRERSITLKNALKEHKETEDPLKAKFYDKLVMITDLLDMNKLKDASVSQMVAAGNFFFDKLRLLEGKSTQNIAKNSTHTEKKLVAQVSVEVKELRGEISELAEFAKANGIELPNERNFIEGLKKNGEIFVAPEIISDSEMESALEEEE